MKQSKFLNLKEFVIVLLLACVETLWKISALSRRRDSRKWTFIASATASRGAIPSAR